MTTSDWINLAIAIPAVCTFLAIIIYRFNKFMIVINQVLHEFRPNGGNSLRDRIDHLETRNIDQTERLDRIEKKLNHL